MKHLPLGVMTEAEAQGTSQDETPGSGSDATAGFALSLPGSCEVPESLHHPVSGATADDAELDITIPEVPPLDELA